MRPSSPLCLAAAVFATCACASSEPEIEPLAHPYKVVLLPIEGAEAAVAPRADDAESVETGEVPFALSAEELRDTIRKGILGARVFSEIVLADASQLKVDEFTDTVAAASSIARRERADLIMRVSVSSARMQDLGPNDSKYWSAFTWFMIPAPIWYIDDRTYATSLVVNAELYDPSDPIKPTASVVASSTEEELDMWDRGVDYEISFTPPAWHPGDLEQVSVALTNRAVFDLMEQLVEKLRTRDIPSRFDVALAWEDNSLDIEVRSRRRLRSLEVRSGDTVLRAWAEREAGALIDTGASSSTLSIYRARVDVPAGTTGLIRVIASDEAGGREVRSTPVGEGR
jgi:hypothetical protein